MADQTILLFPTRLKMSGTLTLAAATTEYYDGEDGRQKRRQFIVTNLDTTLQLKIVNGSGKIGATVFPQTSITLETTDTVGVYNPDGSSTVDYEVLELFYDPGVISFSKKGYSPLGSGMPVAGGGGSGSGTYSPGDSAPPGKYIA